jgi:hypothetical protein
MTGGVADEERLYRRVRECVGVQLCYKVEGDRVVFQHAAFNDPGKRPSVDRACLKIRGNPHHTRLAVEDGVVAFEAGAVRGLGPIDEIGAKNKPTGKAYEVWLAPDPKVGNCAHALISMTPPDAGGGTFKRLKEGLVWLANQAGWTVEPKSALEQRPGVIRDAVNCLAHRIRGSL